jgi:hypothetical protein
MIDLQSRELKFTYFLLGIALPIAGYLAWSKTDGFRIGAKKKHVDEKRDLTLEDSFPASDPPAAW